MTVGEKKGVAGGHRADRSYQLLGRVVLEDEAARAGPQRLEHVLVEVERREKARLRNPPRIEGNDSNQSPSTTFDLDEYVFEALRAGASGFLLKDGLLQQSRAAIRTVAAGDGSLLSPTVTRRVIQKFALSATPGASGGAR